MAKAKKRTKPAKKPAKRKQSAEPKKVLVLRTCDQDLKSHGGFQWPESGPVECADWDQKAEYGNGLHGLLWGEGDGELLNWSNDAKWLVVEVDESTIVQIGRKVKFPRGVVLCCGDRKGATDFLVERLVKASSVVGCSLTGGYGSTLTGGDGSTLTGGDMSTLTGGYRSTLTGGYGSTLTGGDRSTLTGGDRSTLTGGYGSTLTGGDRSTLTGGYGSTLTGGDRSVIQIKFFTDRRRIATFYVGENGILPNVKYRANQDKLEPVKWG